MATGKDLPEDKITLNDIAKKLDSLAASIERLTQVILENQASLKSVKTMIPPKELEKPKRYATGPRRYGEREDKSSRVHRDPFAGPLPDQASSYTPVYIPQNVEPKRDIDESGELDEKIRKWEADNPW